MVKDHSEGIDNLESLGMDRWRKQIHCLTAHLPTALLCPAMEQFLVLPHISLISRPRTHKDSESQLLLILRDCIRWRRRLTLQNLLCDPIYFVIICCFIWSRRKQCHMSEFLGHPGFDGRDPRRQCRVRFRVEAFYLSVRIFGIIQCLAVTF